MLTANVDTAPSPYFRLERTAVEAGQMFTPTGVLPAPQTVGGLGLEAYWFPDRTQLMSTDGVRLVTVTVRWPRAHQARQRTLAVQVSKPYLRTPPGAATSSSLAKGAPAPG
jgi:hypothetical protein